VPEISVNMRVTDGQFATVLDLLKPEPGPCKGQIIQQWLRSMSPQAVEAMWLAAGDYDRSKGEQVLEKLMDAVSRDARLWPEGS
jgi:hypothetical protein